MGPATKVISSGLPMAITMANAGWILDLLKDRSTQYGLDHITKVPTSGTGDNEVHPRTIVGVDYWSADIGICKDILVDIHWLPITQVQAYSG